METTLNLNNACHSADLIVDLAAGMIDATIRQAAESVRTLIVIPFCTKHNVMFMAGNNDWFFLMEDDHDGVDQMRDGWGNYGTRRRKESDSVRRVLRKMISNHEIGCYVEGYNPFAASSAVKED